MKKRMTASRPSAIHPAATHPTAKTPRVPPEKFNWLAAAILLLPTLLIYIPAMRAGLFTDDDTYVMHNSLVVLPSGLWRIWFSGTGADFFPLTLTTFWLEFRLWATNPTGYHVLNILLHGISAILLWRLLLRLRIPGAFFGALFFAVHPVSVASVAWISERKNTLSMLFFLLSLNQFVVYLDRGARRNQIIALLCFLAALLSKTSVVGLPLILLAIIAWRNGRLAKRDLAATAPFFAVALILGLVTIFFQYSHVIRSENVRPEGWLSRIAAMGWEVWFYLWKALVPVHLLMIYPRWDVDGHSWLAYLPLLLLIVVLAALWRTRQKHWLLAAGYYLFALVPVLGFFKMSFNRFSFVSDHFQYLAIIAPVAMAGVGIEQLRRRPRMRKWATSLGVAIAVILGALTWSRSASFQDLPKLWDYNYRYNPQPIVLFNRGTARNGAGRFEEGFADIVKAVDMRPNDFYMLNCRGEFYEQKGMHDAALADFARAVALHPGYSDSLENCETLRIQKGQYDDALADVNKALAYEPRNAETLTLRGRIYTRMKNQPQAMADFTAALAANPYESAAYYRRALLYMEQSKWTEAFNDFSAALNINPGYLEACQNRAYAAFYLKRYIVAWADVDRVRQLGGKVPEALLQALSKTSPRPLP